MNRALALIIFLGTVLILLPLHFLVLLFYAVVDSFAHMMNSMHDIYAEYKQALGAFRRAWEGM